MTIQYKDLSEEKQTECDELALKFWQSLDVATEDWWNNHIKENNRDVMDIAFLQGLTRYIYESMLIFLYVSGRKASLDQFKTLMRKFLVTSFNDEANQESIRRIYEDSQLAQSMKK